MFSISVQSFEEARKRLSGHQKELGNLWTQISVESAAAEEARPWVQLSSDEIEVSEIDRILGYADIPQSAAPIGLPFAFAPIYLRAGQQSLLIFPIDGLEDHIRRVEPGIAADMDRVGSMDAYTGAQPDMNAIQYFVAGLLACCESCRANQCALSIRW